MEIITRKITLVMKNLFRILSVLLITSALTQSCEKETADTGTILSITPDVSSVAFSSDGTVCLPESETPETVLSFAVSTNAEGWSVVLEPEDGGGWLLMGYGEDGNSFSLSASTGIGTPEDVIVRIFTDDGKAQKTIVATMEKAPEVEEETTDIHIEGIPDGTEISVMFTNNTTRKGNLKDGVLKIKGLTGNVKTIYSISSPLTETVLIGRPQSEKINLSFSSDGKLAFRTDPYGRRLVNTFAELAATGADTEAMSASYIQESDINLLGSEAIKDYPVAKRQNWNPIGGRNTAFDDEEAAIDQSDLFQGTYNGNGFSISDIWCENKKAAGLFGCVGDKGSVISVNIISGEISSPVYNGYVCCYNFGIVRDCTNDADGAFSWRSAGVCAHNDWTGTVSECGNSGNISGDVAIGGICGENYGTVSGCTNSGNVTGSKDSGEIGGVVGISYGRTELCTNDGNVSGFASIGGIAGASWGHINEYTAELTSCLNTGAVTGIFNNNASQTPSEYIGGITGMNNHSTLTASVNKGKVSGIGPMIDAGGIAGYNWGTVASSYNEGDISGYGEIGGVVGYIAHEDADPGILSSSYNIGTVTSDLTGYAGSVCGFSYGIVTDCYFLSRGRDTGIAYSEKECTVRQFGENCWPVSSLPGWGIGDGSNGGYWKDLGRYNSGGSPEGVGSSFPILWWE